MSKIILGFVGTMASGKDVSKKYIETKYGAQSCRFSSILRDVLKRINVDINRPNLQKLSTVLRQSFGEDAFSKAIANDASTINADIVIVDGVRRMTDITHLIELQNFHLIKIDAKPETRYERMKKRNGHKSNNHP